MKVVDNAKQRHPWLVSALSVLLGLSAIAASTACTSCREKTPDEECRTAQDSLVENMVGLYITENYEQYVNMMESNDRKPAAYRAQMVNLLKQRHRQQEEEHGGPKACRLVKTDDRGPEYRDAYVRMIFRDGTAELIVLPMVCVNGEWRLK